MKKIDKFVLKSYLGPMVLTFLIVMFVLMMNFVWRYIDDLVGKGLDSSVIIELLCYAMANMIPMGLPLATLFAAIMTMGNLGENYELLAMKSAGMSLLKILRSLLVVICIVAIGSFFVANNLVPYSNKKMYSILYDISQQKQTLEFQDGMFFNGVDNLNIRVGTQDPETKLLRDVLIYDNRNISGNMSTTVADSGYIRLSDDKKFLLITLYNGESYEQTRNSSWHDESTLRRSYFKEQNGAIPTSGFSFERTNDDLFTSPQTKNINELDTSIDSLETLVTVSTARSYEPLLKEQVFQEDITVLPTPDSLKVDIDKTAFKQALYEDTIASLSIRERQQIWNDARTSAASSRSTFSWDESSSKESINQLYKSKVEWHRKISLPVSIIIFFIIGAALGAIIRKGGLGMPIVVSVLFFVVYYIISITGEKLAIEGSWSATAGMWLSTFILAPLSAFLIYKATNDSNLFNVEWYYAHIKKFTDKWSASLRPYIKKVKGFGHKIGGIFKFRSKSKKSSQSDNQAQ